MNIIYIKLSGTILWDRTKDFQIERTLCDWHRSVTDQPHSRNLIYFI